MAFYFDLYRAPDGLPPLIKWEENHADNLGSADELQDRLAALLPGLKWDKSPDGAWMGRTTGMADDPVALQVRELEPGRVHFIYVAASPPVLRQLMSALGLNYCHASESGELREPFSVGDDWDTR